MRVDGNAGSTIGYEPNTKDEWQEQPDFSEPPLALSGAADRWNHSKPISCDLHDYLEIACLYKIQVYLTLANGVNHCGIPVTIKINVEREECLQIQPDSDSEKIDIPLYLLENMKAITSNTHFNTICFVKP